MPERAGAFHLWALLVPMALYSIYFALLAALTGLGWSIHLWAGTIVTAGIVGLLLSYLVLPPTEASHQAPSAHYGN